MPDDAISQASKEEMEDGSIGDSGDSAKKRYELVAKSLAFRGPVPPRDMLREYDKVVPGSAARIFEQLKSMLRTSDLLKSERLSWKKNDSDGYGKTSRLIGRRREEGRLFLHLFWSQLWSRRF